MNVAARLRSAMGALVGREPAPPPSFPIDWWQRDMAWTHERACATVEAAISAYAQTIAQLDGEHTRYDAEGAMTVLKSTPLARVLRKPNHYQTRSDFFMNLVRVLYFTGNSYALAQRDEQSRIVQLHLLHSYDVHPIVNRETGDIFYEVANANQFLDIGGDRALVPQRDMLHVRLQTPHNPLVGETPLKSAAASIATNTSISSQQNAFFRNMSRPSGVLTTEQKLSGQQMSELRQRWEEQSHGINAGRVPILANGLKWDSMSLSADDAQIIQAFRMTVEDIARAFRVPLPLVNVMEGAQYNNAEQVMSFWIKSGLGFLLDHIELALDDLFRLPADQYAQFDVDALLRSDIKARMEAYGNAVTKGIYSPNEVRRKEGLAPVQGGDMPRVQQQMVPLDWEGEPSAPPPAAPVTESAAALIGHETPLAIEDMRGHDVADDFEGDGFDRDVETDRSARHA